MTICTKKALLLRSSLVLSLTIYIFFLLFSEFCYYCSCNLVTEDSQNTHIYTWLPSIHHPDCLPSLGFRKYYCIKGFQFTFHFSFSSMHIPPSLLKFPSLSFTFSQMTTKTVWILVSFFFIQMTKMSWILVLVDWNQFTLRQTTKRTTVTQTLLSCLLPRATTSVLQPTAVVSLTTTSSTLYCQH